jgi:hypothetical protein
MEEKPFLELIRTGVLPLRPRRDRRQLRHKRFDVGAGNEGDLLPASPPGNYGFAWLPNRDVVTSL